MNIKEYAKNYNLKLTEEQLKNIEQVMRQFENDVKIKGDILPTFYLISYYRKKAH